MHSCRGFPGLSSEAPNSIRGTSLRSCVVYSNKQLILKAHTPAGKHLQELNKELIQDQNPKAVPRTA
jgi:hypothetical protein